MKEITVEANIENLRTVLMFVGSHISGCPSKIQNEILLAVDEAFSNIARYSYAPETGDVKIRVDVSDEITVEFEDCGIAYDPLAAADPDIKAPAEEREIGGLGIFLVKNMTDSVEYRREADKNILTITKNL